MGLTNKQFDTIMQEYDSIRNHNRRLLESREAEIREKFPVYFSYKADLNELRLKRAEADIHGDTVAVNELCKKEDELKSLRDHILTDHGYPGDYLTMSYRCPICKDKGFLPDSKQKCTCFIKAQTGLLFEQSGLCEWLEAQNFDSYSTEYFDDDHRESYQKIYEIAKDFIAGFQTNYQNLLFYGNVGTGKTFLSCCIAKELMEQGISVTYCSAEKLFRDLVDLRFQEDKDSYFSFMEDIFERDLLIIDDLGTERITDRAKSDLFTCLNNRHIAGKSTIISTNLSLSDLREYYSDRIFSRISSNYTLCVFDGSDIRMKIKLKAQKIRKS